MTMKFYWKTALLLVYVLSTAALATVAELTGVQD